MITIFTNANYSEHDTGPTHPERPGRIEAILSHLKSTDFAKECQFVDSRPADTAPIEAVHSSKYVNRVKAACEAEDRIMDSPDTPICKSSYDVALHATGGILQACDLTMTTNQKRSFCLSRPPGHHAEKNEAMGFCLFNHIAIAAHYLTQKYQLNRVAIVDFDVHHGNGTQHLLEERPDILFISMHEHPKYQYPGTGYEHETGIGAGQGFTLNVPLLPESNDKICIQKFDDLIVPKLQSYKPEFLLISAGFDAAKEDPLGHLQFTPDAFTHMTSQLVKIANEYSQGRIVSLLEGGYNLDALAKCTHAHLSALNKNQPE